MHSHVVEFLSAVFAHFNVTFYLEYHCTAVSEGSRGKKWSVNPFQTSKVQETEYTYSSANFRNYELCPVHCPFPVSSLRASVHPQQHFFPPTLPLFWLEPLFSSLIITYVHYVFGTTRMYFEQIIIFYSSTSKCILKINHYFILWYYKGLGLVPSLSSWDVELLSCFPMKVVAGKCNAWLHFTPQYGLALGDRSRKISTPGCGPPVPPDLLFYSTQEGHPSWFPLVPSD